jgi:3'-phosphoadenosine 5'-phosphosulfate sulfotransferase (PAPS reductase)/FAD synthetase
MNPYLITGPALISFSGGRTSAFMLHKILEAHGGTLPDDVVVVFANTGKEREETLRFIHECGSRWGVRIRWLEYLSRSGPLEGRFEEVGFNSASRNGEPFARLIADKSFTPNSMMRFCTEELKVNTLRAFVLTMLGWAAWTNVVGLRYDEGLRVMKALARNDAGKSPWKSAMPLSKAKVTKADVMAFWAEQPFDLGLKPVEGNCDLCFLKGRNTIASLIRRDPSAADWWIEQERVGGGSFKGRYTYAQIKHEVETQPYMPGLEPEDDEFDAECGLVCSDAA